MNRSFAAALLATAALPGTARAQTTPADFTTHTSYDLMRRALGTIAPDPDGSGPLNHAAVRNSYDADGRLVKVEKGELATLPSSATSPSLWTGYTAYRETDTSYDSMDRKVVDRVVDPQQSGTTLTLAQYNYDPVGRFQCTQVRMDQSTFGNLAADACTPANGSGANPDRVSKNVYDNVGQLVQVWRALGTNLAQAYETYSYTPNGKQSDIVDANGNHARMIYDGLDRAAQWQFPSTAIASSFDTTGTPGHAVDTAGATDTNDYEAYTYDANDNRIGLRKRDGRKFGYSFDALNRMTVKAVPTACVGGYSCTNAPSWATRSVYYGYDAWGRQTAARFDSASGGDGVLSGYDGFGRLTSSTTAMNGTSRTLTFGYDADGDRTQLTFPDNQTFTSSYDGLDRETLIQQPNGTGLVSLAYNPAEEQYFTYRGNATATSRGFDGAGRLNGLSHDLAGTANDLSYVFGYNPASQIVSRTSSNDAFGWSGASNASKSYTVNGLSQYTSVAGAAYSYDSNGNLTTDGTTSYIYDAENRLVSASNGTTLTYDPNGRLWQTAGGQSGTTQFLYDGDQLSAEYDGSGSLLRRYVHGTGEDDPLVWYEGATLNSTRFYQTDHQGSIVAVSDASGNPVTINSYDEYGVPASGNQGRFQYTGQAWLPDLGLYHYKARVYSPKLGRMLQTDPVGYKDQINLYAYVANDPVNHTDPLGLEGEDERTKRGEAQLNKDVAALNSASNKLGSPSSVSEAAGALKDIVVTAPKIGVDGANVVVSAAADSVATVASTLTKQFRALTDAAHSVFRRGPSGKVTHYETYNYPKPRHGKRVDIIGPAHGGVSTPHVVDTTVHTNPNDPSRSGVVEGRPRPAEEDELPR